MGVELITPLGFSFPSGMSVKGISPIFVQFITSHCSILKVHYRFRLKKQD